jgi:hypothetical protein
MRTQLFAATAALALAGCSSSVPSTEERRFPDLTVRQGLDQVHARCTTSLLDSGFRIGGEYPSGIWGPWVKDRGFSWQFRVGFEDADGIIRISTTLVIRRDPGLRHFHDLFRGSSEIAIDDAMLEGTNLGASARDREELEAGDNQVASMREERIFDLRNRVAQFLVILEKTVALPGQEPDLPPAFP